MGYREGDVLTMTVQGLEYKCPPLPPIKSIRRTSNRPADQVYQRDESYLQWKWSVKRIVKGQEQEELLPEDQWLPEQKQWYYEEIKRLHYGSWIFINGVPVYFNKYAHFFHQWFCLRGSPPPGQTEIRPIFKEAALEYFRFFELCEEDRFCLGDIGIKGRRFGLSSMSASNKLLMGLLESDIISGIVSKTGTDAQEMYFMIKYGIQKLPLFLSPQIGDVNDSEIFIGKKQRVTKDNPYLSSDNGKNNRINYRDTSETAYDGGAIRHITIDEAAKFVKANVKTFFNKVSEALVIGATIIGKLSLFSTVDEGDKGGDNFRELWDGSDHIDGKKDAYGRTKTKLKRFFLPAYHGFMGYIGKYGESIIENPTPDQVEWLKTHQYYNPVSKKMERCPDPNIGAKQYLQVNRDMLAADPESLANEIRKNPFEWKEVFRGANNTCNFNLEELNDQIEKIEAELVNSGKKENGRRVRFTSPETFVDDPAGMWYILKLPKQINKHIYRGGVKCPDNTDFGAAGMDTYANARSTVDKGSNACVIIHSRYDAMDPENSDEPAAMFLGRPSTKGDFHNQVFWGVQYYGVQLLAERSPTDWEDYAIEHCLASKLDAPKRFGYLAVTKRSNDTEVYGVAPQDKQQREQHLTEMKEYANHKIHKIKFLALLRSMIPFDIDDRTDYDECMAWGYALMCLKGHVKKIDKPKSNGLTILKVFKKSA